MDAIVTDRDWSAVRPERPGFDERGLPGGGLWLLAKDAAACFGVGMEAVRRWRTDPTFPPQLAVKCRRRCYLNVVGLLFWRLDCIRRGRNCSAAEAVELLRGKFRGLPVDADGRVRGLFS
jgi:hypothetical protein